MSSEIKAVIFDQGGVLTRGGGRGVNENAVAQALGLSGSIEISNFIDDLRRGKINNAQFVERINQRYSDAPNRLTDKVWDVVYTSLRPEPLSYDLARRCLQSGRRVGLLSNINPGIAERLRKDGSYQGFDPLVLSCYVGYAKPDPEIYALVEIGLRDIAPENILLLDDQDKCIVGARKCGWQALKVTSTEQMVRDVNELLGLG